METVGALLDRERRSDAAACRVGTSSHVYDYRRFCTTAWKVGNFLRGRGVRAGVTVGVAADPNPKALLSVLGAGLLGATVRLDPSRAFDGRAVVAPLARIDSYDLPAGAQRVAYGDDPDDPALDHWETGVWSENPTMPPEAPGPEGAFLVDEASTVSQGAVLRAAADVATRGELTAATTACLRARPDDARAVAGALAPLTVGAELLFPGDDATGDVAVVDVADGETDVPESRRVALPDAV